MPFGFIIVGSGNSFEQSSNVWVFKAETLCPFAVLCCKLTLLVPALSVPVRASRVEGPNIEPVGDVRRGYNFEGFTDRLTRPDAIISVWSL